MKESTNNPWTMPNHHSAHGQAPIDPQLLMTPREAASALRISPRKLWEITDQGELPFVRIGRCVRYYIPDLEAWIAEQRSRKNSQ